MSEKISGYAPDGLRWDWDIEFDEVLREGPPNTVRLGKGTNTPFVVVQKTACGDEDDANRLREEIDIGRLLLRRLEEFGRSREYYPPELSRMIGFNEEGNNPFLLMKSLSPTARTLADAPRPLKNGDLEKFAIGLFTGLYWLELAGVVHRDLTPKNIIWDGGHVQIIDFSHATFSGAIRDRVRTPPWDILDDTAQTQVEPFDDLRRAGFLLIYAATGVSPEDLRSFHEDSWHRDPGYVDWLGRLLDEPDPRWRRPRADDILRNLRATLPELVTLVDDPRMTQGRDQFNRLKDMKDAKRADQSPRAGRRGLPKLLLRRWTIGLYTCLEVVAASAMLILMLFAKGRT